MVLGVAKAVTKAAKLIGETKNLRVLAEQCDDGAKVISSFDKKTGGLVKQVTKYPVKNVPKCTKNEWGELQTHLTSASRKTWVEDFRTDTSKEISHWYLRANHKGQQSLHNIVERVEGYFQGEKKIYVFNPDENKYGLRACVCQPLLEPSMTCYQDVSKAVMALPKFENTVKKTSLYSRFKDSISSTIKKYFEPKEKFKKIQIDSYRDCSNLLDDITVRDCHAGNLYATR